MYTCKQLFEEEDEQTWMAVGIAQKTSVLQEGNGPWIHIVLHQESAKGLQIVLGGDETQLLAVTHTIAVRVGEAQLLRKSVAIGGEILPAKKNPNFLSNNACTVQCINLTFAEEKIDILQVINIESIINETKASSLTFKI